MKIKLLFCSLFLVLLMTGCKSKSNSFLHAPVNGRTAYVFVTQNPITQEDEGQLDMFNRELDGTEPYYPEEACITIASVKSETTETYLIRFEQNNTKEIEISQLHSNALEKMKKRAKSWTFMKSFTLYTISASGETKESHVVIK